MTKARKPRPLTPRMQRFVAEYLVDLNATQAYIRAGYSPVGADRSGARLLGNVGVRAAISAGKARQLRTSELSAARVLEELRRLAFVDMQGFFNEDGNCKQPYELTPEQSACVAGFEVLIKNAKAGDGVTDLIHKFRLWDKTRALEMLAKHYALLTEVVRVEEQQSLEARLIAGRTRVAEARKAREATSDAR